MKFTRYRMRKLGNGYCSNFTNPGILNSHDNTEFDAQVEKHTRFSQSTHSSEIIG